MDKDPGNPGRARQEYTRRVKHELDAMNARLDELDARVQLAKAEVRQSYLAEMERLRQQSRQVGDKFRELQASGEATWDRMVQQLDKLRDAFGHAVDAFKSRL